MLELAFCLLLVTVRVATRVRRIRGGLPATFWLSSCVRELSLKNARQIAGSHGSS